jgi:hypothetical protein
MKGRSGSLTPEQAEDIRQWCLAKAAIGTVTQKAAQYGVSATLIRDVCRGRYHRKTGGFRA